MNRINLLLLIRHKSRTITLYKKKKNQNKIQLENIKMVATLLHIAMYISIVVTKILQRKKEKNHSHLFLLLTKTFPKRPPFLPSANCLGTIVALPMCGLIIAEVGWPTVFYVSGSMSLVWVVFWMTLMHDTPEEHPRISPEEREYIVSAVKAGTSARNKVGM